MTLLVPVRPAGLWPAVARSLSAGISGGIRLDLSDKKKKKRKLLPKDAFSRKPCPKTVHLIDEDSIHCISKAICPDPQHESAHIVECSAGPGFLTKQLLESGIKQVHVFECEDNDYVSMLEKLSKQYEGRVSLHLRSHYVADFVRDLRFGLANILPENSDIISYRDKWKEEPPVKSFIPLPPFTDKEALHAAVSDLCRREGLFGSGRSQLTLLISYFPVCLMLATPQFNPSYYGYLSVMAQSLFDVEIGQKIPLRSIIPLIVRRRVIVPDGPFMDTKNLFLVSMTPKASLVDDIPIEFWGDYRFFVRQAMYRKSGHVIPFFEKYFPNCGIRLIRIGIPLYSRFSELTPGDFVTIFNEFISWPEYSTSTFKMASASFAEEVDTDEEEEEVDKVTDGSEVSGSEKLVSDVFA